MKNSSLDTEHHDDMVDLIGIRNLKEKHVNDEKRRLSLSDVVDYEKVICENAHLRASVEKLTKEIALLEQKRRENEKLNCENLKLNTGLKEFEDLKMKCADFEDETKELKMQLKKSATAFDDSVAKCLQLQRDREEELEEKYRLQIDEGNARIAELNNEVVNVTCVVP
ncbi:uncharacterized protein LOC124433833 [Xenia sp. Carnegie-2017]|uniref:uncharacterized protein LOC124433833 n=1 Tax=Xenia sp. Carnegie-2017 TaxID=2897299 RepID=UPI001F04EDBD|nr:uncharacterized protein LOC124433833 [Xenia sp. Carnegie-2017]